MFSFCAEQKGLGYHQWYAYHSLGTTALFGSSRSRKRGNSPTKACNETSHDGKRLLHNNLGERSTTLTNRFGQPTDRSPARAKFILVEAHLDSKITQRAIFSQNGNSPETERNRIFGSRELRHAQQWEVNRVCFFAKSEKTPDSDEEMLKVSPLGKNHPLLRERRIAPAD